MTLAIRAKIYRETLERKEVRVGGDVQRKTIKIPVLPKWLRKKYAEHIKYYKMTVEVRAPETDVVLEHCALYPELPKLYPQCGTAFLHTLDLTEHRDGHDCVKIEKDGYSAKQSRHEPDEGVADA